MNIAKRRSYCSGAKAAFKKHATCEWMPKLMAEIVVTDRSGCPPSEAADGAMLGLMIEVSRIWSS
ncbi:MAG TPA: hypothetical protein VGU64_08840 [Terriglobales bacterium]|nr:hypothetical protein [Terriglobales bacterium]